MAGKTRIPLKIVLSSREFWLLLLMLAFTFFLGFLAGKYLFSEQGKMKPLRIAPRQIVLPCGLVGHRHGSTCNQEKSHDKCAAEKDH